MKRLWILVFLLLLVQPVWAELEDITRFFVVRHAEKADGQGDVHLSPRGVLRAQELVDALHRHRFAAVYSTTTNRTKETALPLAGRCALEVQFYPAKGEAMKTWAKEALLQHRGKNVLVVGHSNTVPEIVKALSGEKVQALGHDDYDDLFEVVIFHANTTSAQVKHHHFGAIESVPAQAFEGELFESWDLSAVVRAAGNTILGADEGAAIQQLDSELKALSPVPLNLKTELDLEGLAHDGQYLYAVGSHSKKRKNVEPDRVKSLKRSYKKNRARLSERGVRSEASRHHLFRLKIEDNVLTQKDAIDLSPLLQKDSTLAPYTIIPSKENGVDIEGLAARDGHLYVGFRGPVLRSSFVPVMRLSFERPEDYELLFLPLDGRGIRSITEVSDGFLVLAGPVGDSDQSFKLYHWDGKDCVPGDRATPQGQTRLLGTVINPLGAKAEGLTVIEELPDFYLVLMVFDSVEGGSPQLLQVPNS